MTQVKQNSAKTAKKSKGQKGDNIYRVIVELLSLWEPILDLNHHNEDILVRPQTPSWGV